MGIIDFFDRGWRQGRSRTAYIGVDRTWTFDEARELSCQVGHALLGENLGGTAKVAVLSPNDPVAWMCVLGIWRAGMAWVPLNPANSPEQLAQLIDTFDCDVLIFHSDLRDMVESIRPQLEKVRCYVYFGDHKMGDVDLWEWVADQPIEPPMIEHSPDHVVAVASTGGTTGVPKGVMNTNRSLGVSLVHLMLTLPYRAEEPIVNLVCAPMTHASGIISLAASARGGAVTVIPRADPSSIVDAVQRHGVTEVFLPPTVIYRLLDLPDLTPEQMSSMRYLIYGAAPMSVEKLRQGIERLGPVFVGCYGQTEAYVSISFLRAEEHLVDGDVAPDSRLASTGRPFPLVEVEIRDAADRPVGPNETGEIVVRGDLLMKGYYKEPEKTAETIVDGWLRTGDIGFLDDEGYLSITDRAKDIIISGGYNIYPSEVEQVIWSHPAVQDCAVIGVPHEDWGEAVTAVVELRAGEAAREDELLAYARERLGGIRAPKGVIIVPSLPRSPNGKVLKKDIRAEFWRDRERMV